MSRFSHLSKLQISGEKAARLVLDELDGAPTLLVLPATDANKPYFNKVLRGAKATAQRLRSTGLSTKDLEAQRAEDREMYPEFIIRGWEGMPGADGGEVPFDADACHEFLEALPSWIFDRVRRWCSDPRNFLPVGESAPEGQGEHP